MNDSLNMINQSRNKFLNKSFQQNKSGSASTKRGQQICQAANHSNEITSNGEDSSKLGSTSNFNPFNQIKG
jgi:hypothetical protein